MIASDIRADRRSASQHAGLAASVTHAPIALKKRKAHVRRVMHMLLKVDKRTAQRQNEARARASVLLVVDAVIDALSAGN